VEGKREAESAGEARGVHDDGAKSGTVAKRKASMIRRGVEEARASIWAERGDVRS
jgi:hypothetical protein